MNTNAEVNAVTRRKPWDKVDDLLYLGIKPIVRNQAILGVWEEIENILDPMQNFLLISVFRTDSPNES